MNKDNGETTSLWQATAEIPNLPPLSQNLTTDVVIVGAGLAGVTAAYLLCEAGKKVVLVDDGPIGGGETGRTTAHLTSELDDRYHHVESSLGEEAARTVADSQTKAIDEIERIVKKEKIDCDFLRLDGYLFPGVDPAHKETKAESIREFFEKERDAAKRAGITGVELVQEPPVKTMAAGPWLRFPNQAQFHPLKYMKGLVDAIIRMGGTIHCGTHISTFEGGENCRIVSDAGVEVKAKHLLVATNTPVNDWVVIHTKQAAYRTYVIGARVPTGTVPGGLYWDTEEPYHYIRTHPIKNAEGAVEYDILIVGGEDHKTGQDSHPDDAFRNLEDWSRQRFPMIQSIDYKWSGQVLEPHDGLPFLGKNPMDEENVYVITGDSGMGMTNTTCGAMIVRDLILGKANSWSELYDPGRISLGSTPEFIKENVNFFLQYYDWLTPGDVDKISEIANGDGAIIREGLDKVAVYKDEKGQPHFMTAVCPHLKCIVEWNGVESTWDCPCHGSRFDKLGRILNGPALKGLDPVKPTGTAE